MALIWLAIVIAVIAALYHFILHPLFRSPLARIPAVHPLAKFTSLYMLWVRWRNIENATVFAGHQKHGQVIRLGPSELSVNCIDDGVKTIYGKNFDRHPFYRVYEDCGRQNLSSSLDAYSHTVRKRRVTHIYSKTYLQSSPALAGLIKRVVRQKLLSMIAEYASEEQPFDTMNLFSAFALDMVTGYTFGLENGANFLDNAEAHAKCIHEIHNGRPYETLFWLHEFPQTVAFLENIGILSKDRYQSLEALHVFCLEMCTRTETALAHKSATEPENFPTVYLHFKHALEKEGVSAKPTLEVLCEGKHLACSPQQLEIAAEVGDQIHASDETLSITLTYAIWELSQRPDLQQRLRKEFQTCGSQLCQDSTLGLPAAGDVDSFPLLHGIVMETMRVHPVVAGGQARVTPYDKPSKLGKYENIPGGIRVQSYARFLHHNPEVFPDPLAWHPERWLPSTAKTGATGFDQKYRWFWAFSSGGRMCLGSNFALLVMKYVLSCLYASFETYVVNDDGIEHMEGYVGGPKSKKLLIGAKPVSREEN